MEAQLPPFVAELHKRDDQYGRALEVLSTAPLDITTTLVSSIVAQQRVAKSLALPYFQEARGDFTPWARESGGDQDIAGELRFDCLTSPEFYCSVRLTVGEMNAMIADDKTILITDHRGAASRCGTVPSKMRWQLTADTKCYCIAIDDANPEVQMRFHWEASVTL